MDRNVITAVLEGEEGPQREISGVKPDEEEIYSELRDNIGKAEDYMSEFADDWERAERYFNGETDLALVEGRSKVVFTAVRNAIRGVKPSLIRIFATSPNIVEYIPTSRRVAATASAQTKYVNNVWAQVGGYEIMSDLVQNSLLKGIAPVKWYYKERTTPQFFEVVGATAEEMDILRAHPGIAVLTENDYVVDYEDVQTGQRMSMQYYDAEVAYIDETAGDIVVETIPLPNFFVSRNAGSDCDAVPIIGHARNMTIGELVAMGFDYDDLIDLDAQDPEVSGNAAGEATERRKKSVKEEEDESHDPSTKEVLITEAYARYDFDGLGVPQLWKFFLGGTERVMLRKERAERVQMAVVRADLIPHSLMGGSIYDIAKPDQDTLTSILRGTVDNLHMSNNRRLAVHETLVNIADVMSPKIGAPIRVRSPGQIQEIGVQPMIGTALPLLQYLGLEAQTRVGVTAASMGLDPDALQSTDKDAVRNTIQLGQGQTELMARNIAHTLMPVFRGILHLSMTHKTRWQTFMVAEQEVSVDQMDFDPDLFMQPAVGLGTESVEQQRIVMQTIIAKQQEVMTTLGPANPVCNLAHVSRAYEDLLKLYNVHHPERYFNIIDDPMAQQLAAQQAEAQAAAQAEAASQPNPVMAALQAEQIKATSQETQAKIQAVSTQRAKSLELQFKAMEAAAKDDLERDRMAQQRYLETAKIEQQTKVDNAAIEAEQNAPRKKTETGN